MFLEVLRKTEKYRYQLRKKLKSKNDMCAEISSCAQQKFHGYEFLREELRHEKKNLVPLDIVYEPPKNTKTPIYSFFAPKVYMTSATFYKYGEKRTVKSHTIQQCPYCKNFFRKPQEAM